MNATNSKESFEYLTAQEIRNLAGGPTKHHRYFIVVDGKYAREYLYLTLKNNMQSQKSSQYPEGFMPFLDSETRLRVFDLRNQQIEMRTLAVCPYSGNIFIKKETRSARMLRTSSLSRVMKVLLLESAKKAELVLKVKRKIEKLSREQISIVAELLGIDKSPIQHQIDGIEFQLSHSDGPLLESLLSLLEIPESGPALAVIPLAA